ncbi:MAG: hypothetical protein ACR2JI_16740 [Mycobacterium sp.]
MGRRNRSPVARAGQFSLLHGSGVTHRDDITVLIRQHRRREERRNEAEVEIGNGFGIGDLELFISVP